MQKYFVFIGKMSWVPGSGNRKYSVWFIWFSYTKIWWGIQKLMKVSHANNTTQILWQLILSPTQVSRTSPQGNSKPSYLLKWSESHSVVSDSFQSPGVYSPWNSPGQHTGVGSLLQGIYPTQELNPDLPNCRWILYQLSHKGSLNKSKYIIFKNKILKWHTVAHLSLNSAQW